MDFRFEDRRIKTDAIIAFLLGVAVAYLIQIVLGIGPYNTIFNMLIVAGVAGFYYQWRRVV